MGAMAIKVMRFAELPELSDEFTTQHEASHRQVARRLGEPFSNECFRG